MDTEIRAGITLERAVRTADRLPMLRKQDLRVGDWVQVRTFNSSYMIRCIGENRFAVSGGWFDRQGPGPYITTIAGCTWGGSLIKVDVAAACGLCIEFGNRVRTSMVRRIVLFPTATAN